MRTWICGGTIVTEQECFRGDLLIEDGRILAVSGPEGLPAAEAAGAEAIDAAGKLILCALFDHEQGGTPSC